jgi:hypothetical protein
MKALGKKEEAAQKRSPLALKTLRLVANELNTRKDQTKELLVLAIFARMENKFSDL